MGGVGKTTLLKRIYKSLLDDANMGFNHVLFIEASKGIQLEELRKRISESLQLQRAGKEGIFNVLKISNFVLLLDNICEEVDLISLGIPHPYSDDNSTKQCYKHKVIFTTRSEDVCAKMGAGEKTIKVECLGSNDSWDLFRDNVNLDVIVSNEEFKKIARQVMGECSGLPLALKVIGKAMSNKKSIPEWNFVLRSLKSSSTRVVGMEESLFPILKFSYDNLPDNIRECFLFALMLRRISKYELSECWMGLGLIGDFVDLPEAFDKAEYILKILEESCLLYVSNDGRVHFHDVIHEMAKWIATDCGMNRNKWIVKDYHVSTEISTIDTENWRFAKLVIMGHIKLLPILSHRCSDLLCLFIKSSFDLQRIPEGFFLQMPNLIFLDLSLSDVKELPKDIKCLFNLQYLNVSSTAISSLPKELVYLNKLQYLLCGDTKLSKVKDGLLSRLHKLRVIDLHPTGWVEPKELQMLKKHNNIKAIGMRVVSQEVFQQLSYLPTTGLYIQKLDNLISLSYDTLSCKNHGFLQELTIDSCLQLKELVLNGSETHLNNLTISNVEKL
ncbi:P-loop containing nucleoside triphosphate hydrolase protein [Dioscorea alata]|uniref:P-loop containing nucleoside triphosphate hydrolase protein n=1 Tax=Dioscorea alata TaxID=55571 RepID=A0ACB7UYL0_DIOAL|nr:P-loop containing nucleoside triphosphate hydrolase protein [Dioscorea alata]